MARFKQDPSAQKALANTVKLATVKSEDFDTVFYPGGNGPVWDLAESSELWKADCARVPCSWRASKGEIQR